MLGTCRLCLKESDLQDSHILPKWAYKRARDEAYTNPNPVIVSDGEARQHCRQHREYMLCSACEQSFSKREAYVAKVTSQPDEQASLLTLIGNVLFELGQTRLALPGQLDMDALVYFGASVVWRASLSREVTKYSLGDNYEERFRSYLNGEDAFPRPFARCGR
jgi:hypothetical protein